MPTVQVSAYISHLQTLEELPVDVIVPARLVLDASSAERVRDMIPAPRSRRRA